VKPSSFNSDKRTRVFRVKLRQEIQTRERFGNFRMKFAFSAKTTRLFGA
jgi:hypothetical protein